MGPGSNGHDRGLDHPGQGSGGALPGDRRSRQASPGAPDGRVPVQRTVLGRGSMDAARIPPQENRGDQLNAQAVPEVGARCRRWVVFVVLGAGRAVADPC